MQFGENMGLLDDIARKIFNKEDYEEFGISLDAMDGCVGESTMEKIRRSLRKLVPC